MSGENNALSGADDAALFDQITQQETTQSAPEPVEVQTEQQEQPVAQEPAQQQERESARVPLNELLEERRARQALERDLAELRGMVRASQPQPSPPPPPPATIYDDDRGFVTHTVSPLLQQQTIEGQLSAAAAVFGDEEVRKAIAAHDAALYSGQLSDAEKARIGQSMNRFAEAVRWHQEREKRIATEAEERFLSSPEFLQKALERARTAATQSGAARTNPPISLPSLAKVGSVALPAAVEAAQSDDALWHSITSARR
jgi:hypothetical protein